MRYEDASNSFQASGPNANDDSDTLSAGSRQAATGNLITGEGTQYGAAGADSAAGGHITSIAGKGGEDSSFAGGKLSVTGEHGNLSVDAEGNYNYIANKGAAENVRDRFIYTLADSQGGTDTAALVIELGKTPVVIKADAQQVVPGPDGVVTLPPGVELSDVMVVGRNLVINMPDGTQLIIVDGAIFVPQLVLDGVQVPATNVAALLIGQEPQPAAGELPPSSGGNFALPPPPLDPGVPLGDLIPPTVRDYTPPEPQEVLDELDEEPEIFIQPDGQPASVSAVDSVDEKGLPTRDGNLPDEPEGSGEGADGNPVNNSDGSEATTGTIIINSPDGVDSVTINGILVTGVVGQEIPGEHGILVIEGFDGDNILYSYVLDDNTNGNATQDDFSVVLTDDDGDEATATLTIDIIDDVPTARDDTDAVTKGQTSTDGNVMTGTNTTSGVAGADTVGADNAELTGIHAGASGSFTTVPDAGVTIAGQFGDLTINPDGSYTYTTYAEVGNGGNDVFTYQLTDGDGDTENATLTITVPPDLKPTLDAPNVGEGGTEVDEAGLPTRNGGEPEGSGEEAAAGPDGDQSEFTTGVINFTPGDTPATITINGITVTGVAGQTFAGDYGTLTITGFNANGTINYSYQLLDNVDHDTDLTPFEEFDIQITDVDGDSASDTLRIDIVNDAPIARADTDSVGVGGFSAEGNVISASGTTNSPTGKDTVGADNSTVTFIDSVGNPAPGANVPGGSFVDIEGQYGTLRIYSNGDYEYTRDAESPGGVEDVFNYTLTDSDGDTSVTTLTIDIPETPIILTFGNAVGLDDDALPGGNPGGPEDDDPDTANTVGDLNIQGGDGALTFELRDTGAPAGFTYQLQPNGDLWVIQDSTGLHVVTITLDDTGHYTVTQVNPIDHPTLDNAAGDNTENNITLPVTVRVTDVDGDFADATGQIIIDDDTPIANDDTDSISGGGTSATGNVITGSGTNEGTGNADSDGADGGGTVVGVAAGDTNTNLSSPATVGAAIVGTYGTLTLNADGSYSYARNPGSPGGVNDTFTYTITDSDGDLVNATLTINIGDSTPGANTPAMVIVDDDDVPGAGGNPGGPNDDAPQNTSGTLTGSGGDGDLDFYLNVAATDAGLPAGFDVGAGSTSSQITIVQGGTTILTITLNNETGQYTVVQNATVDHETLNALLGDNTENNQDFNIVFYAQDVDGDQSPNTNLVVRVDDDTPIANDDTDSISGGGTSATGNVITGSGTNEGTGNADSDGADGGGTVVGVAAGDTNTNLSSPATVGAAIVGTYGTLTLNADGSYSYARNPGSPGGVNDTFTYTITDSDGDLVNATLTINIGDSTPGANTPAMVIVDDDDVPGAGGNPGGPNDDAPQNTSGTLTGSGGDGDLDFYLNVAATDAGLPAGFDVGAGSTSSQITIVQGGTTILTITLNNETGQYTVVQNATVDHETLNALLGDNTENNQDFNIVFYAQDEDGDQSPNTNLVVRVDDDTPIANDDTDSISGGGTSATGNVITGSGTNEGTGNADSDGADGGGTVVGVAAGDTNTNLSSPATVGAAIVGTYGTLTLNADGSYSYARNPGSPGGVNDTFTYTITDSDGDLVNATLTINIGDSTPGANTPAMVIVDDDDVPGAGGNPGGPNDDAPQNTSGTLTGSGGDGDLDFYLNVAATDAGLPAGFDVGAGSTSSQITIVQGGTTILTITLNNETGQYTVVQNATVDHETLNALLGDNTENNQDFNIVFYAQDVDGDQSPTANLTVRVDDDSPVNFTPVPLTDVPPLVAPTQDDALVNDGTANVTRLLNDANNDGVGENFIGADGFGDIFFTGTAADDGQALTSTSGTPLTAGGAPIYLFGFGTGVLTATTSADNSIPGAVVFTVTLNEGAGYGSASTYTIDFNQAIDDGSGFVFDDFSSAPAGQNDWVGLDADGLDINDPTDPNANSEDLLLTPTNVGGSINTSSTDIGNANQWIDNGEGVRLDYVVDVRRDPGQNEKDVAGYAFDGHYNVTDSSFQIMQTQGGGTASVRITAYNDSDSAPLDTLSTSNIVAIDPASIVVTGQAAGTYDVVVMADGSVVVTGLEADSSVEFEAIGDVFFNSYSITNANGVANPEGGTFTSDAFAVGVFGFNSETAGSPVPMSFDVTAEDADGDTSTGTIDVTLVPSDSNSLTSLASTSFASQEEQLQKSAANSNTLTLATAVAAAGFVEPVAAHDNGKHNGRSHESEAASFAAPETVERYSASDAGDAAVSMLAPEASIEASAPAETSSSSSDNEGPSSSLDDSAAQPAPESNDAPAADESGSNSSAEAVSPVAPTVAMVSAEVLQADLDGGDNAQEGGSVEQIVAEAMQNGGEDLDAVLANLPGGNGGLQAIAHMASPEVAAVSGWHTGGHGAVGAGFDMMFKMDVAMHHQDAVQPVANG